MMNTVELNVAQDRILRWRKYYGEQFETKAFYISIDDIEALSEEIKSKQGLGVRAYVARNESNEDELLMVVVVPDETIDGGGRDVISTDNRSEIYDLTTPCPNLCDETSPLCTISSDKKKVNLNDLPQK